MTNLLRGAGTPEVLTVIGGGAVLLTLLRRLWLDRRPLGARIIRIMRGIEIAFLALLLGVMVVLSVVQIVLRNLVGAGLLWIDPLLRYLTLWIGLMGAAFATAAGRHIQIDVLARLSPPRVRAIAGRVVSAAAAVATLVLAETAYRYVIDEVEFGAEGFLGLPSWALVVVIPFAFALMSYRFLYRTCAARAPGEDEDRGGGPGGGDADGTASVAAGAEVSP